MNSLVKENISLKDIVKDHIDNEKEFTIEEKEMLTNIIGFGKSRVEDSMVPRADIISANINTCLLYTSDAADE